MISHFIFYVSDQKKSSAFYAEALNIKPQLDVPGMTEFKLSDTCVLGLMPSIGIKKLLGNTIQDPEKAKGIARAELYLRVPNVELAFQRALKTGAKILSPISQRNWGSKVGYIEDPDGHIVAFSD